MTDKRHPEFKVIKTNGLTTYAVTIPDNDEGISLLDELGRAFSHRGLYDEAKRIANIVVEHRTGEAVAATTEAAKSKAPSKQAVSPAQIKRAEECAYCGFTRGNHQAVRHPFTSEKTDASIITTTSRRPRRKIGGSPGDSVG